MESCLVGIPNRPVQFRCISSADLGMSIVKPCPVLFAFFALFWGYSGLSYLCSFASLADVARGAMGRSLLCVRLFRRLGIEAGLANQFAKLNRHVWRGQKSVLAKQLGMFSIQRIEFVQSIWRDFIHSGQSGLREL